MKTVAMIGTVVVLAGASLGVRSWAEDQVYPFNAFGQIKGTIEGVNWVPPGCIVTLTQGTGNGVAVVQQVEANRGDGAFSFDQLKPGEGYDVTVVYPYGPDPKLTASSETLAVDAGRSKVIVLRFEKK